MKSKPNRNLDAAARNKRFTISRLKVSKNKVNTPGSYMKTSCK